MTDNIKKSLKERCKLTKLFCKNGQMKTDHDKVLEKSAECTKEILEAKKNYIPNMTKKPVDSNTAPKMYWIRPVTRNFLGQGRFLRIRVLR